MSLTAVNRHLKLAIFRLEDVCVRVQDGMEGFLRTAALAKSPEIEATFRWFRKRGVSVCLLSGYDRAATEILLNRLDWEVGEDGYVQMVILREGELANPIHTAVTHAGLVDPRQSVVLVDTPRLLRCAQAERSKFVLGLTNGSNAYQQLACEPHHALLDSLLQLPNFLLRQLPEAEERSLVKKNRTPHLRPAFRSGMRG
ncbi:MAG: hypothetical protein AAFN92_11605 [Bacteroidota bacterium]